MSIDVLTAIVLGSGSSRNSPFLEEVRKRFFPHCAEIQGADALTYAISDLAFGSNFLQAYAHARVDLPRFVNDPRLKRAFKFLLFKGPDAISAIAVALGQPHNWTEQTILQALLCTKLTYAEIGNRCGLPAKAVEMYAVLHFDFRDRGMLFRARAINPNLVPCLKPRLDDQQQRAVFWMNLAHTKGFQAVLEELNFITHKQASNDAELFQEAKRELIASAGKHAKFGELNAKSAEFSAFETLLKAQTNQQSNATPTGQGPEAMSMTPTWQSMVKTFTNEKLGEHVQAIKQFNGSSDPGKNAAADASKGGSP
jgi:hypothetical protein